jgi:hypothetical protein
MNILKIKYKKKPVTEINIFPQILHPKTTNTPKNPKNKFSKFKIIKQIIKQVFKINPTLSIILIIRSLTTSII